MDDTNELPILAHLSLKSMVLSNHDVILYTYSHLGNVPEGVTVLDANEIINGSKVFIDAGGHKTYAGFSDLFRYTRLYNYGGTWLDLDVLLIGNINEKYDDDIFICSEPTFRFYMHPNCGAIRFPKGDSLVEHMLNYSIETGNEFSFGQIGPRLITESLKEFPQYNKYLKTFNIYQIVGWKYLNDYSKEPEKLFNKINMDEIFGFHINNTFFKELLTTENPNGFFELLKKSILESNSYDEYQSNLKRYGILERETYDDVKDWDLKYLDIVDDNYKKPFKYTILIDSKNLKKVEIYNILHSIGFSVQDENLVEKTQIIIFGKTNMGNDKIRFKDNIIMVASDFKRIYPYIWEYIYGEYVIPINKPVIFTQRFFKNKTIDADIENYTISDNHYLNILNKKDYKNLLYKYGTDNIFNLNPDMLEGFNYVQVEENLIFNYESRSEEALNLINIIDDLNKLGEDDISSKFLKTKNELKQMEFLNLIDEVSFYYYSSYQNILESSSFYEYLLKEQITRLNCLNSFYLNKLNIKYKF